MVSCSIDNVLNMFDMNNHDASKGVKLIEEDIIDGAYSSMQPLIDCGFITPEMLWTITSINTVEFIRVSDAVCFLELNQVSLVKNGLGSPFTNESPSPCNHINRLTNSNHYPVYLSTVPSRCDVPDRS